MAFESPKITAACVEATEFIDLSRRYRVTGVPKTIVNGTVEILGALPEDAFVRSVLARPGEVLSHEGRELMSHEGHEDD